MFNIVFFLSKVVLFSLWFLESWVQIYYWELWTKNIVLLNILVSKIMTKAVIYQDKLIKINQVCILIVSNQGNFGFVGLETEKILIIKLISMRDWVTCRGTVQWCIQDFNSYVVYNFILREKVPIIHEILSPIKL